MVDLAFLFESNNSQIVVTRLYSSNLIDFIDAVGQFNSSARVLSVRKGQTDLNFRILLCWNATDFSIQASI